MKDIPFGKKGTAFSKYAASKINQLLPKLPDKIQYWDIHASHPLGKAIIIRFVSRDLRNEVYRRRSFISDRRVSITEHLTSDNLALYKKAVKASATTQSVWTDQCRIYTVVGKRKREIKTENDLKMFKANSIVTTEDVSSTSISSFTSIRKA